MASQNACLRGCLKKNRIPRISSSFRLVFKGVRAEFTRSFYIYKVLLIKKKVTWWKREINTSMKIVKAIPLEKIIQFSSIGRELHTWKYYGFLEELRMLPSNIDVRNRHGKMCGFFGGVWEFYVLTFNKHCMQTGRGNFVDSYSSMYIFLHGLSDCLWKVNEQKLSDATSAAPIHTCYADTILESRGPRLARRWNGGVCTGRWESPQVSILCEMSVLLQQTKEVWYLL